MRKPAIVALDDDVGVLHAVERDLRARYADRFRVLATDTGVGALETLTELRERRDPVALLLVDQRMPQMSGVEFISHARELFPEAKRALLTAYADTDAAIAAINEVSLDHYLLKPWDPPQERLYPVLDDLLDDWVAGYRPPFEGVRLVGHRWSPEAHQLRDFLGRNQVPFRWLDLDESAEARALIQKQGEEVQLPLAVLADGEVVQSPAVPELAARLGMSGRAERPYYDLVVVGAGPAGLASAVYGASEGLNTLVIEREAPGGQAGMSSRIENYLGFPAGLSGGDLARRALIQARRLGAEILSPREVSRLRSHNGYKLLELTSGEEINARALVLSTGVSYRRLDAPGAERLTGAGVYYGAAVSEAANVAGEDVYIIGGANSAGQAAVFFAQHARDVHVLVRGDSLEASMSQYLVRRIAATPNIHVLARTAVTALEGTDHLERVTVRGPEGDERTLPAAAIFIFIGAVPHTDWLAGALARDGRGYILTGRNLAPDDLNGWPLERRPHLFEASIPGVFAAGDVRHGSVKRVASAVGDGSVAVTIIHRYLSEGG